MEVSGNYAYLAEDSSGLEVLDISNPAAPTKVGSYATSGLLHSVEVSGNYAYLAEDSSGLEVLDISNPAAPTKVGSYNTLGNAYAVVVSETHAYIADGDLTVLDISNPAAPTEVGRYGSIGDTYSMFVSGNYAYLAEDSSGLEILNISDPSAPTEVGSYATSGLLHSIAVSGNYAYLAEDSSGLEILNISKSYTLTPTKEGYTFSPTTASGTLTGNATHNFTGTATVTTYTITGTVTVGGSALSGVTVTGSGSLGSQTTDGSGNYSFTGVASGTSYTLTPSKAGYTFSPITASGTLTGNATHNFTGTLNTYTISGHVKVGGSALSGVTVTESGSLGSQTTNGSGNYSFTGVASGTSYALTPSKAGYTFSPITASGTLTGNTTKNFTATLKDSDGDGVNDLQEGVDSTNPNDSGSYAQILGTTVCSEWNSFLGIVNIMEHVNLSSSTIKVTSKFYNISGKALSEKKFSIKSGNQFDLIVNDMTGFAADSYGKICSTMTKGKAGDLDGRMVYYKTDTSGNYQFAFAMPFGNGLAGRQYVQYDTLPYTDSVLNPNFAITNWIQITNLESTAQSGTLKFYSETGSLLKSQAVKLNSGARQDIPAHQFGASKVGLVEWLPKSATARFQLRNVRYYYDNATGNNSFDAAFQYEGVKGSGETLVVPYDQSPNGTSLDPLVRGKLLISNTTSSSIKATVAVYQANGTLNGSAKTLTLAAHTTINGLAGMPTGKGIITIDGATAGSVIATLTQSKLVTSPVYYGIQNIYGLSAAQPLGSVLKGSYNTFLSQGCSLLLANPTSKKVTTAISMKNYTGSQPLKGAKISVPSHGLVDYDLCSKDKVNVYGVVTVQPTTANSVLATVLRKGAGDSYRFPTPARE